MLKTNKQNVYHSYQAKASKGRFKAKFMDIRFFATVLMLVKHLGDPTPKPFSILLIHRRHWEGFGFLHNKCITKPPELLFQISWRFQVI